MIVKNLSKNFYVSSVVIALIFAFDRFSKIYVIHLSNKSLEDTKVIDISSLPKMDYTKLTKAELKKLCDEKEINYTKSSNKAKLVELLIGFESDDNNTINLSE